LGDSRLVYFVAERVGEVERVSTVMEGLEVEDRSSRMVSWIEGPSRKPLSRRDEPGRGGCCADVGVERPPDDGGRMSRMSASLPSRPAMKK